jgi:hypothetical protein
LGFLQYLGLIPNYTFALGKRPAPLDQKVAVGLFGALILITALFFLKDLFVKSWTGKPAPMKYLLEADPRKPWHTELWLLAPFAICFLYLIASRNVDTFLYDRYLFGLIPFAIIWISKLYSGRFSEPLPIASYLLLTLIALFSIAGTHDWFAMNRARTAAASILQSSGIPDREMQLGIDYDGWTQLKYSPAMWQPKNDNTPTLDSDCVLWSWNMTPVVAPKYFVVLSPMPCLAPSRFAPVHYRAWLPPLHRTIYIQQRP